VYTGNHSVIIIQGPFWLYPNHCFYVTSYSRNLAHHLLKSLFVNFYKSGIPPIGKMWHLQDILLLCLHFVLQNKYHSFILYFAMYMDQVASHVAPPIQLSSDSARFPRGNASQNQEWFKKGSSKRDNWDCDLRVIPHFVLLRFNLDSLAPPKYIRSFSSPPPKRKKKLIPIFLSQIVKFILMHG